MSVFLVWLATLQQPAMSKVVRKLVLEGELEVGSLENIILVYVGVVPAQRAHRGPLIGLRVMGCLGWQLEVPWVVWRTCKTQMSTSQLWPAGS